MTYKSIIINSLLIIVAFVMIALLSGCVPKCEPRVETLYKTKIEVKEVKVEVPCKVPEVKCDFKGDGYTPTIKLLECITEQKKAIESCNK